MFLTERQGGSDVGANTTRAVQDGEEWLLFGREALLLQRRRRGVHRPGPARGRARRGAAASPPSSSPASSPTGPPTASRIKRLKPKLGTVGVPTGEVALDGARAWLAGGPARPDRRRDGSTAPTRRATAAASTA